MRLNAKGIAAGLLFMLFLTSCDPDGTSGLPQDFDRSGEELRITVIFHTSQAAVDRAYVEEFGRKRNASSVNRLGFAVWANPGKQPYWCRIHAQKPKKLKDEKMKTLGHELTHCLLGTFHPEPN